MARPIKETPILYGEYRAKAPGYFKPSEVVRNAIDRCLGVALFVQYLGMDYEDSNREYEIVKEKLEKLLDNNVKA